MTGPTDDEIRDFKERHGLGEVAELARKADLSEADHAELRTFFALRAENPDLTDDDVIRIVLTMSHADER